MKFSAGQKRVPTTRGKLNECRQSGVRLIVGFVKNNPPVEAVIDSDRTFLCATIAA